MSDSNLKATLEAILYVSEEPVSTDQLAEAFPETPREALQAALDELAGDFGKADRGVTLRLVAGGWRLSTRLEYHEPVRRFLKSRPGFKLSMAALETLAIIAYKQPATVPEIMAIRGVKSPGAVKTLLEKKLIAPRGRRKVVGSPMQYGTSKEFLLHFGLASLKDLPTFEEFEEIFGDKADQMKQKSLFDAKLEGIAASGDGLAPGEGPGEGPAEPGGPDTLFFPDEGPLLPGMDES